MELEGAIEASKKAHLLIQQAGLGVSCDQRENEGREIEGAGVLVQPHTFEGDDFHVVDVSSSKNIVKHGT